ncbi:MAG TPA: carboxypeptidase-like regulatory domain-containing protein, partial [Puia sp.]
MRKKRLLPWRNTPLFLLFIFFHSFSFAQNRTISGTVTDSAGGPGLAGATILVQGSKLGTQTKADGSFQISAPSSATHLVISSVGFKQQTVPIGGGTINQLTIALDRLPVTSLSDVVVI